LPSTFLSGKDHEKIIAKKIKQMFDFN